MQRPTWILCAVLAVAGVMIALTAIDEPAGFRGEPHPEFTTMRQGGDAAARHRDLLLPGWLLGCAVILCFSALVHFGALRGRGRKGLAVLLRIVTAAYLAAWSWLIWSYRASLSDTAPELILALPKPTAIMIYVFWPVSMLFSALFVIGFDRWVLTEEEEEAFDRLVERTRTGVER